MSLSSAISLSCLYLFCVLIAAWYSEKSLWWRKILADNGYVYALSLTVYCTAWTFYGSIGRASSTGIGYLGVYLGPTLLAPLWILFLKKIIRISKHLRITSIADFVSARYGKNTTLGVLVSILNVLIAIPYISIQLKALDFSFKILLQEEVQAKMQNLPFYLDPSMIFLLLFIFLAIFFGTRKLDPSEKHPGLVSVVAIESIIKLIAFLIGAIAIVYGVFNGVTDIFTRVHALEDITQYFYIHEENISYQSWFWIAAISGFAFMFLPRQFHMAVVENNSVLHLKKATWLTPLYFFLISMFVIPVAFAGKIVLGDTVEADTFLMSIPSSQGMMIVVMIVFIGGLSAISGMIIISMLSLSIMISNNIFLPLMLRVEKQYKYFLRDLTTRLLQVRRLIIIAIGLLAYGFYKSFTINLAIVSVGLMSFAGIAQLAPILILGLYWKYASTKGAIAGFVVGVVIWAYTLPFANLAAIGVLDATILEQGPFGINWLRPNALFGLEGMDLIPHGTFWSLLFNTAFLLGVSLNTRRTPAEIAQSDIFINPEKYYKSADPLYSAIKRKAKLSDIRQTLSVIFGDTKAAQILSEIGYASDAHAEIDSEGIDKIERVLSGSFGSASADIVLRKLVYSQPINKKELLGLLDQTYQVYEYSKTLQSKQDELLSTTLKLEEANKQLKALDDLKSEFISNVTHELRTPITSIRSLSNILANYKVSEAEKAKFLAIINEESLRISHLVNQVLDLRKMEIADKNIAEQIQLINLIETVVLGFAEIKENRTIQVQGDDLVVYVDKDKFKQLLYNLISNAIKFTDSNRGRILIQFEEEVHGIRLCVQDNGIGIAAQNLPHIFERFFQVSNKAETKTQGSGLGLAICKKIVQRMGGEISVESQINKGTKFCITIPFQKIK